MNLTGFALENSRLVSLVVVILVFAGIFNYLNFPSKEDPETTIREAVVTALYPGMSPRRIENLITRKLEKKIRLIPEVKHIKSSSRTGMSIIHVQVYERFYAMKPIWQNLRNKMKDVISDLPEGTMGPFVNDEFGDVFVATIPLTAKGFSLAEMREVARKLRDELYTVRGTKKVVIHGVQQERVFLEVSNARLARYGLSPDDLIDTLQTQNVILPGGKVDTGASVIVIEPSGNFQSVQDIENTVIKLPATQGVTYLKDIVKVTRAYIDPPQTKAYFNGDASIVLAVSMMKGENVLEFSPRLKKFVEQYEQTLPIGYVLDFATYQAKYVAESVQGVAINVYETLGIVLVVVIIFLGVRTGFIVGTVVPLTMLVTIVIMRVMDIEMQRVSLATMIIALGLLVDNGIVIAEEIGRRLTDGEDRLNACMEAGKSLALPLLTSSITTILAFVPLALAPDDSGEYLRSMAQVITITLLSSWVLATMVTPLMCYWWMKKPEISPEQAKAQYDKPIFQRYKSLLLFVLRIRWVFVGSVAAALVGALFLLNFVPQQFMPNSPRNQFMIYVDLPAGYGTKATDREVKQLLTWLNDKITNPEIVKHIAYVGYGGPRFFQSLAPRDDGENIGYILVTAKDAESVPPTMERVRKYLIEHQPLVFARLKPFWLGTSETGLVEVRISGPSATQLADYGEQVMAALRAIPGTIDIHNNWENRTTKVVVNVDQPRARRAGVTSREVAESLKTFFSGDRVTNYREGDKVIPMMLRAEGSERYNLDRMRTIDVYSSSHNTNVPLLQVADFDGMTQLSRIERRDLSRTITISAKHSWLQAAELEEQLMPTLKNLEDDMPFGYWWGFGGETESANKANTALGAFLPHALAAMVLLMVWQFNSFAKPFIIFFTIPITFIGSILGLLATGVYMGFMATLGFLSLAGIIINNAIVLLDSIQSEIDGGAKPFDSIMTASITRFQPVMMTTLTTVLGLLPLMIPPDPLFNAMAVVISFGIGMGTLLTLLIVPALYAILFRVSIPKALPA